MSRTIKRVTVEIRYYPFFDVRYYKRYSFISSLNQQSILNKFSGTYPFGSNYL